jgi:hypothetical protein
VPGEVQDTKPSHEFCQLPCVETDRATQCDRFSLPQQPHKNKLRHPLHAEDQRSGPFKAEE